MDDAVELQYSTRTIKVGWSSSKRCQASQGSKVKLERVRALHFFLSLVSRSRGETPIFLCSKHSINLPSGCEDVEMQDLAVDPLLTIPDKRRKSIASVDCSDAISVGRSALQVSSVGAGGSSLQCLLCLCSKKRCRVWDADHSKLFPL